CWRAWREFKREQRNGSRENVKKEDGRQGRLVNGFAALDASRDKQIAHLNQQVEALQHELDAAGRRHRAELERMDRRLAAKADALLRAEEARDRGWNLMREHKERLHEMRHNANNAIQTAYAVGRAHANGDMSVPIPAPMPPIPPPEEMEGKKPA
uniref:hypothetical protein n=1 Tax=Roseomonas chloroacetimidivorans TaxID=1766656 RepID=UPI003C773E9A